MSYSAFSTLGSDPSSIQGLTVHDIQATEAKELEKEKDKKSDSKTAFSRVSAHMMKMEAERQKVMLKEGTKLGQELEEAKKKRLLVTINRYQESFPFLKDKIPKLQAKISLPECEEIIKLIREEMNAQRSLVQLRKYCDFGFMGIENFWGDGAKITFLPPQFRLNLQNLGQYHKRGLFREALEPILMEIDIEYPWIGRQTLIWRGLEALSEVMIKTHLINTNPEARKVLGLEKEPPKANPNMEKL